VLAEQALRCSREDERRACADREPAAEERTRQRKCENGVAEPDDPFILAALIEMGDELTMVTMGRIISPCLSVSLRLINGWNTRLLCIRV